MKKTQRQVQRLLNAPNSTVTIQTGEGMLALWGALKSCVSKGDKVLSIGSGVYGDGIGEMATQIGANVKLVKFDHDKKVDIAKIRETALQFKPFMITTVHCETPTGTLQPISEIGKIAKEIGALFYVDFVSSAAGAPVDVEGWNIDLGLLGSQKALNTPPDISIVTVSHRSWDVIEKVGYVGYDALIGWKDPITPRYFPYTPNWHGIAALNVSLKLKEEEGWDKIFERHKKVSEFCRKEMTEMGLKLFAQEEDLHSPTVTVAYVPPNWTWNELDTKLREKGVVFGGSYGPWTGKLFRVGHMGDQANLETIKKALEILSQILKNKQ